MYEDNHSQAFNMMGSSIPVDVVKSQKDAPFSLILYSFSFAATTKNYIGSYLEYALPQYTIV